MSAYQSSGYLPLNGGSPAPNAHSPARIAKGCAAALCMGGAVLGLMRIASSGPADEPVAATPEFYEQLRNEVDLNIVPGGGFRLDRQSLLAFRGHSYDHEEANADDPMITKHWYTEQIDDHFGAVHEQKFWKQKFWLNNSTFKGKDSPVFLYICGEGPCTPGFIGNQRFMHDLAVENGALLIALEHRFFGDSWPTPDMSVHNLRLLSSRQALEDLARFRVWFAENNGLGYDVENSKWISFGGSYAGGVTAWLKMKYPHLFAGSISSSGPVHAQARFPEYFNVVTKSLKYYRGQPCIDALEVAYKKVHDMLETQEGVNELQRKFNVCEPMTSGKDYSVFESAITGQFADSVQYNHQANKIPAEQLCDEMMAEGDPFENMWKIVMRKQNGTCIDSKFEEGPRSTLATLSVDTFDAAGNSGGRQWFWMTCNEFGFFQTAGNTADSDSPFRWLKHQTLENVATQVCERVFNTKQLPAVEETNRVYGGTDIRVDNVTFVNGGIDPWYVLGLIDTNRKTDKMDVIFIEDGSHCADMRVVPKYDNDNLKAARARIQANVRHYLWD